MELKDHQESLLRILLRETEQNSAQELLLGSIDSIFDQHCREVHRQVVRVFPVFKKTIGEADFEKILLEFFARYRPLSADLREVAPEFFSFFAKHSLAADIPILLGMAKLELRREQARLLPHFKALSVEALFDKLAQPALSTLSLQPHVQVSTFEHPVFTVWKWAQLCTESATNDECSRLPIEEYAESVVSYSKGENVETRKITRVEANFLRDLRAGKTLAQIEASLGKIDQSFIESLIADELLGVD